MIRFNLIIMTFFRSGKDLEPVLANRVNNPLGDSGFRSLVTSVLQEYEEGWVMRKYNNALIKFGKDLIERGNKAQLSREKMIKYNKAKMGMSDSGGIQTVESMAKKAVREALRQGKYPEKQDKLEKTLFSLGSQAIREVLLGKYTGEFKKVDIGSLQDEMDKIRKDQVEETPSSPKGVFARSVIDSFKDAYPELFNNPDCELCFYSSVDTVLDYAGGFDCWVELVDKKTKKPLWHFTIDLTSNPDKAALESHGGDSTRRDIIRSDHTFLFDRSDVIGKSPEDENAFSPSLLNSSSFRTMISHAVAVAKERVRLGDLLEKKRAA